MAVIEFKNVTKVYKLYSSEWQKLKYIFNRHTKVKKKTALSSVSFAIEKGEKVALIGHTGSGKTTLLKMIQETAFPTKGEIKKEGNISVMMGYSQGFYSELTGRENIYFRGKLLGMTETKIDSFIDEIIEFAELGDYIDQPVRTYSNVMKAKLGYAFQISSNPDVLVIDGVMSVGEGKYKEKCLKKMHEMCEREDMTVLLATHQIKSARAFTKRGIVLDKGKIIFDGDVEEAIEKYMEMSTPKDLEEDGENE